MACRSQREGAVPGLCPDDGGGVAVAQVHAGGGGFCLVVEMGWLAFQASGPVHKPQHVDGVADCMVLGVWPVPLGPPGRHMTLGGYIMPSVHHMARQAKSLSMKQ